MKIFDASKVQQLPDAILFDTDNTLYPYEPAHLAGYKAVEKKVIDSFSIATSDFEKAFNKARSDVKQRLEGTAASHNRLLYMQRMLEIMGLGSQVIVALDLEQTYWRTFLSNAVIFEGVIDFLDDIRLLSIPTCIVTDLTAQIQFRKIVHFGLDHYFDHIVTSEESGYDKPRDEPFLLALDKMKPQGNCIWMIGDNPLNDIQGARQSINAVTFQKLHKGVIQGIDSCQPDVAFKEFVELRELLGKLNKD